MIRRPGSQAWVCSRCLEASRIRPQRQFGTFRAAYATSTTSTAKPASTSTNDDSRPTWGKASRRKFVPPPPELQPFSKSRIIEYVPPKSTVGGKKRKPDPDRNNPSLIQTLAPRDDEDDGWNQRKGKGKDKASADSSESTEPYVKPRLRLPRQRDPATCVYSPSDWDRTPLPTEKQTQHAQQFFTKQESTLKWATMHFRGVPRDDAPEVCFIGRSNVGKSSLINSVLATAKLAHVSANPGRTKVMLGFTTGKNEPVKQGNGEVVMKGELVLLDTPGYGKGSHIEWGKEIIKYLEKRRQLQRAFILIDSRVGLKPSDLFILSLLRPIALPHQIIMTKIDQVLTPEQKASNNGNGPTISELRELKQVVRLKQKLLPFLDGSLIPEIIPCSSMPAANTRFGPGISHLRFTMLQSTDLHMKLSRKEEAARKQAEEARNAEPLVVTEEVLAREEAELAKVEAKMEKALKTDSARAVKTEREVLEKHPEIVSFDELFKTGKMSASDEGAEEEEKVKNAVNRATIADIGEKPAPPPRKPTGGRRRPAFRR